MAKQWQNTGSRTWE